MTRGLVQGAWCVWLLAWACPANAQDAGVAPSSDSAAHVEPVAMDDGDAGPPDAGADGGWAHDGGMEEAGVTPPVPVEAPAPDATGPQVPERMPPAAGPGAPGAEGSSSTQDAPRPAPAREEDPWPRFIPVPTAPNESTKGAHELLHELVPLLPASRTGSTFGLLVAILLAMLAASLTRRAREALPSRGVIPRVLQGIHAALRLLVIGLIAALLVGLVPAWMGPALPWVLLAAAAALGWSARDLLPDLIAGIVVLFERRIRRGVWLSGQDFSGTVSGVGLRATWLVDPRGHRIAVPNRRLLSAPIVTDRAVGAEHETTLRTEPPWSAPRVRQALIDAVLQSPWVPPDTAPVVLRDPHDPHLWRVRSRLLEARYAPFFEGELLERTEEILAHRASATFPLDEELDDA